MVFILAQLSGLFILLIIALHISKTSTQDSSVPPLLITNLIHENSIHSPSFDPKRTISELADIDLKRSISRGLFLTANRSTFFHPDIYNIQSDLLPMGVGFLAYLEVGDKHTKQLVAMDTGSSLLWINCEPCGLYVRGPLYDPRESSSFEFEYCEDSHICDLPGFVSITCDEEQCSYHVRYPRMQSNGYLARETFKFRRSKETLRNIVFGCANFITREANFNANGILGLGANPLSLVSQRRASKFSYCIGGINDISYPYNTLLIGDKLDLLGARTPLVIENKYFINLEAITVGDQSVRIDPEVFERSTGYHGGMIVDTGSTYSYMPLEQLNEFASVIDNISSGKLARNLSISQEGYLMLCYNGLIKDVKTWFPLTKFQFQGGAVMAVGPENIFHQVSDETFCLGFLPSVILGTDQSILGILMQQYFYVVLDLTQKKISFLKIDCGSLGKYIDAELKINT